MSTNPWSSVDASTVPSKLARELRDAWEAFVADDPRPEGEDLNAFAVREAISASWQRSREAGVDPTGHLLAPEVMDRGDTRDRWQAHLMNEAVPVLRECLWDTAVQSDHLMVIADADGCLLSVRGRAEVCGRAADDMNFAEGALWSEAGAGTNAVGTALAAGHAVQVFAAEHFADPVQRWTCAAAPVREPETGRIIGVIDLTGDFTAVHPHSLAVVIATAQAVEVFLRCRMHEHDARLRARYDGLLDAGGVQRALVSASGRVLSGSARHWDPAVRLPIPAGGGTFVLTTGEPAVAEPAGEEAFVVSRVEGGVRRARPRLEMHVLGTEPPSAVVEGRRVALRPRHAELLVLLAAHPGGADAEHLSVELYGDNGHPASVRVEMSRLRKLLPGCIDPDRYRLTCELDGDAATVRRSLGANAVRAAAHAYPGPLLPRSQAPGVVRERDDLEGWLRNAVLTAEDAEALWSWAGGPSGEDDLMAWTRLLSCLDYADPRRARAASRTRALRTAQQPDAPAARAL